MHSRSRQIPRSQPALLPTNRCYCQADTQSNSSLRRAEAIENSSRNADCCKIMRRSDQAKNSCQVRRRVAQRGARQPVDAPKDKFVERSLPLSLYYVVRQSVTAVHDNSSEIWTNSRTQGDIQGKASSNLPVTNLSQENVAA